MTTKSSRASEFVCWTMFTSPIGDSVIGEVLLTKRGGDPNGRWQGTDFGSATACWARY